MLPAWRWLVLLFGVTWSVPFTALAEDPPAQRARPKYVSPEQCFDAIKEASKREDMAAELAGCSEATNNRAAGLAALSLQKAARNHPEFKEEIQRLLEKHGIADLDVIKLCEADKPRGHHLAGACVEDKVGFLTEARRIQEKLAQNGGPKAPLLAHDLWLAAVTVTGDTATARLEIFNGQRRENKGKTFFRRIDGGWLLAQGVELPPVPKLTKEQRAALARGDDIAKIEPPAPPKYDSPEKCFEAMREASKREDQAAELACCTAAEQIRVAGLAVVHLQVAAHNDRDFKEEIYRLLKKHDVADLDAIKLLDAFTERGTYLAGACVDDKVRFLAEARRLHEKLAQNGGPKAPPLAHNSRIAAVKVTGDTATARIEVLNRQRYEIQGKIFFRRIDGGWLLAPPTELPPVLKLTKDQRAALARGEKIAGLEAFGPAGHPDQPDRPKYKTPQECFTAFGAAAKRNDTKAELACCSEAFQNRVVGMAAFQLQRVAFEQREFDKEIAALYKKHDIADVNVMEMLQLNEQRGYHFAGGRVVDQGGFLAEARRILESAAKKDGADPVRLVDKAKLIDVKVAGDTATSRVELDIGEGPERQAGPFFRLQNGGWVVGLARELPPVPRFTKQQREALVHWEEGKRGVTFWNLQFDDRNPSQGLIGIRCTYGAAGDDDLAGIEHFSTLLEADLHGARISDAGLALLKSHKNLRTLSLADTNVTDKSIEYLAGFENLVKLDLSSTNITPAGVEKIKEALPYCEVSTGLWFYFSGDSVEVRREHVGQRFVVMHLFLNRDDESHQKFQREVLDSFDVTQLIKRNGVEVTGFEVSTKQPRVELYPAKSKTAKTLEGPITREQLLTALTAAGKSLPSEPKKGLDDRRGDKSGD